MSKIEVVSGKSMAVPGVGSGDLAVGVPQLAVETAVELAAEDCAPVNGCARARAPRSTHVRVYSAQALPFAAAAGSGKPRLALATWREDGWNVFAVVPVSPVAGTLSDSRRKGGAA